MRIYRSASAIILAAHACITIPVAHAFDSATLNGTGHDDITHDALAQTFVDSNLNLIQRACDSQIKSGSEAAKEARRHFTDDSFSKSLNYIDREKKLVLDYAASSDTNTMDRARALYHFGLLLHTAQDFYSHTNYLELTAGQRLKTKGDIGDPYSLELVNWAKLPSGRENGLSTSPDIYKEDSKSAEGNISIGNVNYYKAARELALKESIRQWNSIESLIKIRFPSRCAAILAALKQASVPEIPNLEKLSEGPD